MADNITEAFQALHERWEAIFAREQARFATVNQDLPMTVRDAVDASRERFQDAVRDLADDRYMREAVHDPGYLAMIGERARMETVEQRAGLAGRALGADGPDDVRLPREDGPALGSLAAVQEDLLLEANRAREAAAAPPDVSERLEALQHRLEAATPEARPTDQHRDQGREME